MKAGRELDALVAEKVMGFKEHPIPWLNKEQTVLAPDCVEVSPHTARIGCSTLLFVPHYSTSIADAWQVWEKMKTLKHNIKVELASSGEYPEETEVGVQWFDDIEGYGPFYCLGTAPLAICKAALKVVGVYLD